ncbi:PTS system, mannose-specific IIA component [Fictibacillus solisalsi]|uniref:PTS system, mannose-specific IIA component n=1 Tax=Fictibacillus solisalsi TaxID=459525 RepID=A0A1H0BK65_9BACL|nr:PTS sugar transporter subunit IIA [Fictibacillus solisalsi]SDN46056.1 PTS system, mannose-specific IIA component [Fictibacillus solisalsi]
MNRLLIASHGNLAKEIVNAVHMIMGLERDIPFISMNPGTRDHEIREQLKEFLKSGSVGDHFFILTDVFGGSITNICTEFISDGNVHLIAGVNLPMVLEFVNAPDSLKGTEMVHYCLSKARESLIHVNEIYVKGRV